LWNFSLKNPKERNFLRFLPKNGAKGRLWKLLYPKSPDFLPWQILHLKRREKDAMLTAAFAMQSFLREV